ncbi:MAG: RluA family pseudouridine synthase [Chlamydiales bacterium]
MQETRQETILISKEEEGLRLDTLLTQRFSNYSRTYFQYLIGQSCVLIDGQSLKKREKLREGDELEICFLLTPEISLVPENIPLEILYEDTHLLAINKPAGMVVHPAPGHFSGTFANALLFHCKNLKNEPGNLRPGIVHRLDKETTGVLLAAKTAEAHQKLVALFAGRAIQKKYLAICSGTPKEGKIDAPIARNPKRRQEMTVSPEGKEAISVIHLVEKRGNLSLIEVELITGRTHQIRVHLKHVGHPVIGDPVYGSQALNEKYGIQRQLLHAHRILFTHPITHQQLAIEAPIPKEFSLA